MIQLDHRTFERLVGDALDSLPEDIVRMLDNVAVVVADEPTDHQLRAARLAPDEDLLGLYEGIPLTERTGGYTLVVPDKVTIFQRALQQSVRDHAELAEAVRHTVVHELAHHLGIDDARLVALGYEEGDA